MQNLYTSSKKLLASFVMFHIVIVSASNYFVQFPFEIFGIHNTWGAIVFPLIYLASDLTVRFYGATSARKIITLSMIPAFLVSYIITVVFQTGVFKGFDTLTAFDLFAFRIAFASFMAYAIGQWLDILVFARIRRLSKWWVAPFLSNSLGSLIDTLIFFSIAFYHSSDAFMAEHWVQIAISDYGFKFLISTLLFLPAYGVVIKMLTYLLERYTLKSSIKYI